MRSYLKVLVLVGSLMIAAGAISASGQSPSSSPTVDQILAKYVKALGGKAAFHKLTTRVSKGSFDLEQGSAPGTTEIYQKAPDKQLTVTDVPGFGVVRSGSNGTVAWVDNPQSGVTELTGDMAAAVKRNSDFYQEIRMKENYPKMTLQGKEEFNGHEVYVIEARPAVGSPDRLSFDADSGLLVRAQMQVEGPQGPIDIDTRFSDYREVDGVKLPFQIHQVRSDFSFTVQLTEIKHNVPIDDAKFDKPASQ
jgi:outer membrane lipoprotein-sorting protein